MPPVLPQSCFVKACLASSTVETSLPRCKPCALFASGFVLVPSLSFPCCPMGFLVVRQGLWGRNIPYFISSFQLHLGMAAPHLEPDFVQLFSKQTVGTRNNGRRGCLDGKLLCTSVFPIDLAFTPASPSLRTEVSSFLGLPKALGTFFH